MFQVQQDITPIIVGKIQVALYRELERSGKLDGCRTDYEGEIKKLHDEITFGGIPAVADKLITFRAPFDGFKTGGYPSMAERAMQAVQDDKFMAKLIGRLVKKFEAHFPHRWDHFACQMALSADAKGDFLAAIIAVNNVEVKPMPEAPSPLLGNDELDQMLAEVAEGGVHLG